MGGAPLIRCESVSKKFCRTLRRSMLYGLLDVAGAAVGLSGRPGLLRRDEFWAVDGVSLELGGGTTLGVIGENGSGKTTLLKLLAGIFSPDRGAVSTAGTVGSLIALGAGFHPALTGRENIYVNAAILGMDNRQISRGFDRIVEFADIGAFLDTPVKNYSSGMFARLGFSVAVHCQPDILLVDEVLAVGDEGFQLKCFNKIGELKRQGTAVVLVSHNLHRISVFCDRVLVMDRGRPSLFEDAAQGVSAYMRLFKGSREREIEKICSGNRDFRVTDVRLSGRELKPGDAFSLRLSYESARAYPDVEVDTGIYTSAEPGLYFQATNRSYCAPLELPAGSHSLTVRVDDIPVNASDAVVAVAVWSRGREELLFWWRVPVVFGDLSGFLGRNVLKTSYALDKDCQG